MDKKLINSIKQTADGYAKELTVLGEALFQTPELGYHEFQTQELLLKEVEKRGFGCYPFGSDMTGFWTELDTGRPGPNLGIFCEMDALRCPDHLMSNPATGAAHACGHHLQMAAAVGAIRILSEPSIKEKLSGKITFLAVPAEEYDGLEERHARRQAKTLHFYGGKQECIARGLLKNIDIGIMIHALEIGAKAAFGTGMNGFLTKRICMEGKSAHAGSAPHQGINALAAASLGLNAVNAVRETFRDQDHVRIHGIVTRGGEAINNIPAHVEAEVMIRAASFEALEDAAAKTDRAFAGAAYALGTHVKISDTPGYQPLIQEGNLRKTGMEAAQQLFGEDEVIELPFSCASTDLGDVAALIPAIQPYIGGCRGGLHSSDFSVNNKEAYRNGAALLAGITAALLEKEAATAKEIIAAYKPQFSGAEEYVETTERLFCEKYLP